MENLQARQSSMRRLNQRLLQNNQASGDQLQNWMLQLQSGFLSLRRENIEIRNNIAGMLQAMERGFHIINGNVRRAALQPAQRVPRPPGGAAATAATAAAIAAAAAGADDQGAEALERALLRPALAMTSPATLMPNPRSLYDLWNEYLHGVGGRKPARLFSETERGQVKYKYSRRKVIWDVIRNLVSLGHSLQRAIDMIYNVYGPQTSVTEIINRLRKDKNNGTLNPNLQI
ncbi:hypothetical protein MHU86_17108 [Fragilaria crotonensis]|nr:hypothetical protein MHU86_17108 [Fragilaria crotonensis]